MTQSEEARFPQEREEYEAPEIVPMGPVVEITQGMGGSSHDMAGWTIPVTRDNS